MTRRIRTTRQARLARVEAERRRHEAAVMVVQEFFAKRAEMKRGES